MFFGLKRAREHHTGRLIFSLCLIALALALRPAAHLFATEDPTTAPETPPGTPLIYHLKVPKEIGRIMTAYLTRGFEQAERAGADLIVLELNTPGGTLVGSIKGSKVISASSLPTVAWVHTEATSGGAMLAYACDDIVVSNTGTIGDVIPIMIQPQAGIVEAPEKIVGYVAQFMRSSAETNGHDPDLAEAMVRKSIQIHYADFADKMAKQGIQLGIPPQYQDKAPATETPAPVSTAPEGKIVQPGADEFGKRYIVKRNEILNLTWREALFLHVAVGRAVAIDRTDANPGVECITDIAAFSHLRGARIVTIERTWSEDVAGFLSSPTIVILLLVGAFVGIGTELKVPGFGLPGILGITCLVLVFFGQLGAGAAQWTDLILLVIGIALLAVEIFVIPGFGVVGVLGIICIVVGLLLMLIENPPEELPPMPGQFLHAILLLSIAIIASGVALVLLYRFVLPHTPFLGALVLTSEQKRNAGYHASQGSRLAEPEKLIGRVGVAKTKLRPAGRAVFDGEPYDVVSQGDYIDPGAQIEIVEVKSNRIMVRQKRPPKEE